MDLMVQGLPFQAAQTDTTSVAAVGDDTVSVTIAPAAAAAAKGSATTYAYVGFGKTSALRLCPGTPGETACLPDQFHLVFDEGERKDWLGPLGYSAFAGTFKASSGERIRSNPVLLRGGGHLSHLTAKVFYIGYDTFVAPADGMAFALCKLHPHRSRELTVLSSQRLLL